MSYRHTLCDFEGAAWFDCTLVPFISSLLIPHCTRAIKGAPLTLISHPASGANSSAALFLSSLRKGLRTKQHPVLVQYLPCSLARGDRKRNLRRRRCRCIGRGRPHRNTNRNWIRRLCLFSNTLDDFLHPFPCFV